MPELAKLESMIGLFNTLGTTIEEHLPIKEMHSDAPEAYIVSFVTGRENILFDIVLYVGGSDSQPHIALELGAYLETQEAAEAETDYDKHIVMKLTGEGWMLYYEESGAECHDLDEVKAALGLDVANQQRLDKSETMSALMAMVNFIRSFKLSDGSLH